MTPADTGRAVVEGFVPEQFDSMLRVIFSCHEPDNQLRDDVMECFITLKDRERDILYRVHGLVSGRPQFMTVVARELQTTSEVVRAIKSRAHKKLRMAVQLKRKPKFGSWPMALSPAETPAEELRIVEADFSVRTYNCLKRAKIDLMGELAKATQEELLNLRNFGRKQFIEVNEKLEQFGLNPIPDTSQR